MTDNQSRKRHPGEYLEWKSLRHVLLFTGPALVGVAWLIPVFVLWILDAFALPSSDRTLSFIAIPGVAFSIVAGVLFLRLERGEWRFDNMLKGARAEAHVGHAIEWALSSYACAVAHNVANLKGAKEIDHLVATPSGLWVIETKSGYVPPKYFKNVLRKIAENVAAVRAWKPAVNVTGCVVFDDDSDIKLKDYDYNGETIRSFRNPDALAKALRHEARAGGGSKELATSVWELSVNVAEDD